MLILKKGYVFYEINIIIFENIGCLRLRDVNFFNVLWWVVYVG